MNLLLHLWKNKIFNHFDFKDREGNALEIIDFGIWDGENGFQMARIKYDNIQFFGKIVVDFHSSDFVDFDKKKPDENIILYVVYEQDMEIAFLKNRNIPILELKNEIQQNWDKFNLGNQDINFYKDIILHKLEEKSTEIERQLLATKNDFEAVLFHRMAYGFGLKINAEIFQSIAQSLDFSVFRKLSKNLAQSEAFLLGKSGFLSKAEDAQSQLWKREFDFIKQKFSLSDAVFPAEFHRQRPPNFPTIRLSQLAVLYHKNQNLFSKIINAENYQDLKTIFDGISASEYWGNHYKIGQISEKSQPKILSSSFVDLIILNVILPIKYAYHKKNDKNILEKLVKIYQGIPSEKNSVIEEWKSLGYDVKTALHSQSYLYLAKIFGLRKKSLTCEKSLKNVRKSAS